MATRKARTATKAPETKAPEVKQTKDGRKKQVKALDFVPVWQAAHTAEEVSEAFGREPSWASSFASRLRKFGVNLKKMKRRGGGGGGGGKKLDIDELNALAEDNYVEDEE